MTSYSWATNVSGDWNTGTLWTPATVPNDAAADVTIDAATTLTAYTVTIASGESFTVDSLTMNGVNDLSGTNNPSGYFAAELELDGTLAFAAGSAGSLGGSLQTIIYTDFGDSAEIVNGGTLNGFIQVQGNLLLTGTNGVYITNDLQALGGTVTVDTASIAEMTGNTLFDGIFQAVGPGAVVNLGGPLEDLIVNIATIMGPPLNPGGWAELTLNGPNSAINEWNGTAYVPIETTLTEIAGGGIVDVLTGRDYTTTNTLTIAAGTGTITPGLLNLQAGTVTTAGIEINGGIVQGSGTIVGGMVNDGTLVALGGTLDLTSGLTGTGAVEFDFDNEAGTVDTTGATLAVNSVSAGQTIIMNGDDTLVINALPSFAGTIAASAGDEIVLTGVTATSAMLNAGTLVVLDGTQTVGSLALSGTYAADHFIAAGSTLTVAAGAAVLPTISGTVAGQVVTDPGTIAPFSGVTIADPNAGQTETVTVALSAAANGTLTNLGGGSYDATTGVYTDTGSAAVVTTALDGLVFTPAPYEAAPGQTVTTSFTITDTDTGLASATDSTTSVIATAGTVLPTISGTVGGQAVSDTGTIAPFSGVTIGDANFGQTETVTVALSPTANGTLTNLGGGSYNATTGVYTDTGSATAVTTGLDGLVFSPTAHEVAPGQTVTTSFAIDDTDTAGASATDSSTSVIATAGTVVPTITGTVADQKVTDTGTITPFSGVTIGDIGFGQTETVTVTLSTAANGVLTNPGGGSYNATSGTYSNSGSAAGVTAALDALVFVPTPQQTAPGETVTTGFAIGDIDTAGAIATDTTTSVIATAGTVVPTITGTVANQAIADTGTIAPFSGVSIDDVNGGQTETVTVTLSAAANGTLTDLGGGSYNATTGVYTDSGSAAAVAAALDGLAFNPTVHEVAAGQTVTTVFAIADADTAGASATNSATSVVVTATASSSGTPSPGVPDAFFGGATSDVLFANTNGDVSLWNVQNGLATSANGLGNLTDGWSVAGTGAFYGTSTTDILFQNTNGDVAQWKMQDGLAVAATTVGVTDPAEWSLVGTGDFYGTGTDDVLFRDNATGAIAQWQVQNGVAVAATNVGVTTSDWTIAAIGKLTTGAGADSLLFINSNGAVADWTVANGQAVTANSLGQTSSYWSIAGLGDFTGNGQNDILFRGQGGEIAMWTMQNGQVTSAESIGMTTADWQIVGIGDYNGDGTSDILFRNTNGNLAAWEMQNGHVSQVVNVGATSSDWHVAPVHSGITLPS